MINDAIAKVVNKEDLSQMEMEATMNEIMSGEATPAQIGSFITALRMKGETVDEIVGAARIMREKATKINVFNTTLSLDRDEINVDGLSFRIVRAVSPAIVDVVDYAFSGSPELITNLGGACW